MLSERFMLGAQKLSLHPCRVMTGLLLVWSMLYWSVLFDNVSLWQVPNGFVTITITRMPHCFFFSFSLFLLSGFWTSRGHRCRPRFLPSIFIAHWVQQSHCSSMFYHSLALSASQVVHKKSPTKVIRECTRGDSNSRN